MLIRFETFDRKPLIGRRLYYFRIIAANGEPIAQSEGYYNSMDRDDTIGLIKRGAKDAGTRSKP